MCSQDVVATATALADEQAPADREPADDDAAPERESKSRVYDYLSILKDEVVAAGPQRGKRKVTILPLQDPHGEWRLRCVLGRDRHKERKAEGVSGEMRSGPLFS